MKEKFDVIGNTKAEIEKLEFRKMDCEKAMKCIKCNSHIILEVDNLVGGEIKRSSIVPGRFMPDMKIEIRRILKKRIKKINRKIKILKERLELQEEFYKSE